MTPFPAPNPAFNVAAHSRGCWSALAAGVLSVALTSTAGAQALTLKDDSKVPTPIRGLDVEEHVGVQLPLELPFTNAQGQTVHLGDYFNKGKPAIIAMVYYKCPIVCTVVMSRLAETINHLDFTPGKDFNALLFSIDPTETTEDAAKQKLSFISGYTGDATPEVQAGWEFHTGDEVSSRQLSEALGFKFRKLDTGKYSHPVVIFIITPEGKVSRYIYGYVYPPRDVKLALMEASKGALVKTIGDRFVDFCFEWDPKAGSYTLQAKRVMQIGGVLTVAALGTLIGALFIGERIRRHRALHAGGVAPTTAPHAPQGGHQ